MGKAMTRQPASDQDEEKGMSRYCEGSILSRLGHYREAIHRLEEAESYLRLGTNSQQLANCLYDTAICHQKLGELPWALRLLEEALP
jgi:tetratricopeptide (TPR) repeat protein